MRELNEIIEQTVTETGEPDLAEVIKIAGQEMGSLPNLDGVQHLVLTKQHLDWGLKYLGGLVLSALMQLDALPEGFEAEYENLELAIEFDEFRRLYGIKFMQQQKRIEVPGQTSIPIPGE